MAYARVEITMNKVGKCQLQVQTCMVKCHPMGECLHKHGMLVRNSVELLDILISARLV